MSALGFVLILVFVPFCAVVGVGVWRDLDRYDDIWAWDEPTADVTSSAG